MFGLANAQTPKEDVVIEPSTPWMATADGDLALLQKSIEQLQMPIMKPDENGFTVLHSAAAYNHQHILEWIFSSGAEINVNVQDLDGDTPLHHCDNVEAAKILITVGKADASIKNEEGKTALQVKQEEWDEDGDEEEDEADLDDERLNLKNLIEYLKEIEVMMT